MWDYSIRVIAILEYIESAVTTPILTSWVHIATIKNLPKEGSAWKTFYGRSQVFVPSIKGEKLTNEV